jgi:hypothetical protein
MAAGEALRSGFTCAISRPSVFAAEIAWRWALGAAVSVLLFIAAVEYLDSIVVIGPQPFAGAGTHFLRLTAALLGGIVLLASFAAAAGRNAVLLALFAQDQSSNFSALLWLSFLRAVLLIATLLGLAGAWLLASWISGDSRHLIARPDAAGFWLVFCPLVLIIFAVWASLYRIITLAPISAIAQGSGPVDALARAVELIYQRPGELAAIGIVFGVLRLGSLGVALQIGFTLMNLSSYSPAATLGLLAVLAAAYFLFSDYLCLSRMGAYAALVQERLENCGTAELPN